MVERELLETTESVCPECLTKIPAGYWVDSSGAVWLEKTCEIHGSYKTLAWNNRDSFLNWTNSRIHEVPKVATESIKKGCPYDCGICVGHRQQTCCVLIEITERCNLHCPVCFASASNQKENDPSIETIAGWYQMLMERGGPFNIQLSGGEPTLRDDLEDIIALAKISGMEFVQVNTNGIRFGEEPGYAIKMKQAGLNCVFLQFDSLKDTVYETLRGKPLLEIKKRAIAHCIEAGIGVVLVPTVVPDVNDQELGDILRFAMEGMPGIRGVHFQPISYFGRYPENPPENRITIPQMLAWIEDQTVGVFKKEDFIPPGGEHPRCSFHGNFIKKRDGRIQPISEPGKTCCTPQKAPENAKRARVFVARQWKGQSKGCCSQEEALKGMNTSSLDRFLEESAKQTLAVSGMLFQDAWTLDLQRLQECLIHVVSPDGRLIPFCAWNLTSRSGTCLYRNQE